MHSYELAHASFEMKAKAVVEEFEAFSPFEQACLLGLNFVKKDCVKLEDQLNF